MGLVRTKLHFVPQWWFQYGQAKQQLRHPLLHCQQCHLLSGGWEQAVFRSWQNLHGHSMIGASRHSCRTNCSSE